MKPDRSFQISTREKSRPAFEPGATDRWYGSLFEVTLDRAQKHEAHGLAAITDTHNAFRAGAVHQTLPIAMPTGAGGKSFAACANLKDIKAGTPPTQDRPISASGRTARHELETENQRVEKCI